MLLERVLYVFLAGFYKGYHKGLWFNGFIQRFRVLDSLKGGVLL